MKHWLILVSVLVGFGGACSTKSSSQTESAVATEAAATAEGTVSREALLHFCSFMMDFDPQSLASVPNQEKQGALKKLTRASAQKKGVKHWEAFEIAFLTLDVDPSKKSARLEKLVQEYELQEECLAVRDRNVMTEEEQAKLNALMKAKFPEMF
jgi:hypothetical protein